METCIYCGQPPTGILCQTNRKPGCYVVRLGAAYVKGFSPDGGAPTWTDDLAEAARFQWAITAEEIASTEGAEVDEAEPREPTEAEVADWEAHDQHLIRMREKERAVRVLAKLDEIAKAHPGGQLEHALEQARKAVP